MVTEGLSWEPHYLATPAACRAGTATPSSHMLAPAHGPGAARALWAPHADTFQSLPPQLYLAPTSDFPRRSRLEMSKTPPLAAVSTPPVPRFCSRRFSRILGKRLSWCPEKVSVLSRTNNRGVRALQPNAPWCGPLLLTGSCQWVTSPTRVLP